VVHKQNHQKSGLLGVGKSHLVQAIGYQAVKMGSTVLYHSILGLVREFMQDEAFAGGDKILLKYLKPELLIADVPAATAILDRFLQHAEIITVTGKSYRLKNKVGGEKACKAEVKK
jgi:DNA replication protein DnaC